MHAIIRANRRIYRGKKKKKKKQGRKRAKTKNKRKKKGEKKKEKGQCVKDLIFGCELYKL